MRRGLPILSLAVLVVPALAAASIAAGGTGGAAAQSNTVSASETLAPVHVRPARGGAQTAFTISLRIPAQTGTVGQFRRMDSLRATGPQRMGWGEA